MKLIPGLLKKLLKMILAGAFTFVVAACYGIIVDYRFLFHVRTPDEQPIPGLRLDLIDVTEIIYSTNTNLYGDAELYATGYGAGTDEYTVVITDIDGPDNGGEFETKTITVSGGELNEGAYESEYTVTMDPVK